MRLRRFQKRRQKNMHNVWSNYNIYTICFLASHYHSISNTKHVKDTYISTYSRKFACHLDGWSAKYARVQHAYAEHMQK